jgi:hypothetical protein
MRALLLTATLAAALGAAPARAEPVVVNRVVAVVGGEPITLAALRKRAAPALLVIQRSSDPAWRKAEETRKALASALDMMIDEAIFARAAEASGIKITDADVEKAVVEVAQREHMTRAELLTRFFERGWTEADVRAEYRRDMIEWRVLYWTYSDAHDDTLPSGQEASAEHAREAWRKEWLAAQRKLWGVERRLSSPEPRS